MTKPRVLLFEDDGPLANTLRLALCDDFELDITATMADTRILIRRNTYAAIVCDLFILGDITATSSRGGMALITSLRSGTGAFPDWCQTVPIIAISGARAIDGVNLLKTATESGANAILEKPFNTDELKNVLDEQIERSVKRNRRR